MYIMIYRFRELIIYLLKYYIYAIMNYRKKKQNFFILFSVRFLPLRIEFNHLTSIDNEFVACVQLWLNLFTLLLHLLNVYIIFFSIK